jgi:5-methylthioadenosine/S-adenosylhomocysteine deaminase
MVAVSPTEEQPPLSTIDRYQATHVLTQDAEDRHLSPGAVDVVDGRIVWVGPASEAPAPDGEVRTHDLDGVLVPGFVNTHAHSAMTLLRGAGEGLPVDRWLTEVMWPREAALTEEDVHWGMTLGAAQLLAGGITTSVEMYFHPAAIAAASRAAGLRTIVTPPVLVTADLDRFGTWQEQLEVAVDLSRTHREDPLVDVGLGPHSAYAVPEEPLRAAAALAAEHDLLLHIHVAEGEHEGDAITDRHGVTVPRYLERLGFLERRLLVAHAVWLTDDDIALFAANDVGVAHCPLSNGKHASGLAPVKALRSAGIPVGIATDGPASHDRLDPFAEMRAAIRFSRLRERDAAVMGPRDALRMVTSEAARACGREDIGAIEAGRRADLVLVETGHAQTPVVDTGDVLTHLVWSGSPAAVRSVWVEGRRVVRDGTVTTVDLDEAATEVTVRARRLAGRA